MRAAERARSCFRLAAHPNTGEGERAAAMERGLAMIDKYDLDPDDFEIPGRERREKLRFADTAEGQAMLDEAMRNVFGDVFGTCAGCGVVCSVGAYCLACKWKAEAHACRHGQHGYCVECEGLSS